MAKIPRQKPGRSKQDYATPVVFVRAVRELLGIETFQHDFAADYHNSKGTTHYDEATDALRMSRQDWRQAVGDGWGWLNPPYARIGLWADRCRQLGEDGGKVALLVPASVGSDWYRDFVNPDAIVFALTPRLSFDGKAPYPKDCILALYGWGLASFGVWTWR